MSKQKTTEQFIEEAKNVHGNKYDYSKTQYFGNKKDVLIICRVHGEFTQRADHHLKGCGCKFCVEKEKHLNDKKEWFIEKAKIVHNGKYDYSKVEYTRKHDKVCIICPEHGEFWQTANNHLRGYGCKFCSNRSYKYSQEEFISICNEIFPDMYDYSKTIYKTNKDKVIVTCKKHGDFEIRADHLLQGVGCKKCKSSHLENAVRAFLIRNKIPYEEQKTFEWLRTEKKKMQYDFYLPKENIAIECQGIQHFEPVEIFGGENDFQETVKRDKIKEKLSKENGVKILYYSNLNINFPYDVITDEDTLFREIKTKYRPKGADLFLI